MTRRFFLLALSLLLTSCGGNKVDGLLNTQGPSVPVPVPEALSLTISTPSTDGKRAGWSTTFSGTCTVAGATIKITAGTVTSYSVCLADKTWTTLVDVSAAAVGNVDVTAVLINSTGQQSSAKSRILNKVTSSCDDPANRALVFAGGSGTSAAPYLICTEAQLNNVRTAVSSYYTLMNDLDMTGSAMSPIAGNFTGQFDGNSFEIDNYTYYAPSTNQIALFQRLYTGGVIKDLTMNNVDLHGNIYVSAIVAYSSGAVSGCSSSGTVAGVYEVAGLVGRTDPGGTVDSSSSSAAVSASGSTSYAGGLVGYARDAISNSYATGSVTGLNDVGGLVGLSDNQTNATISNSYATGSVSGQSQVGGLVGDMQLNTTGVLTGSHATGAVVATGSNVGGLVGAMSGDVDTSYATGTVTVTGDGSASQNYAGGLAGQVGDISNSYATGDVTVNNTGFSYSNIGGLAGQSKSIASCYATGKLAVTNVVTASNVGGLVGNAVGAVDSAYYIGALTISNSGNSNYAGGLLGSVTGAVTNSYAEADVTVNSDTGVNYNYIGGLVGNMNGGDVDTCYATGNVTVVEQRNSNYVGGLVAYAHQQILNSHALGAVTVTNALGTTTSDVGGLAGAIVQNATNTYATGNVSANGSTIGGLVGAITLDISDSHAIGSVTAGSSYAGGLAGVVGGNISNSYAVGTVSGYSYVGGLVGQFNGGVGKTITGSYAAGNATTTTTERAGGLIGYAASVVTIQNSHATGKATSATYYAGGLVGYASQGLEIDSSYATGDAYAENGRAGGLVGFFGSNSTYPSSISESYAFGNISSNAGNYLGGLVGYTNNSSNSITASYAAGNVGADAQYVGGLVGDCYGDISNSFSVGTVSGNRYVGGIAGYHRSTSAIATSYAIGNVVRTSGTYTTDLGPLIGHKDASAPLTNDYFNASSTYIDQSSGTSFTANTSGTSLSLAQLAVQSSFTGFTFGGGATNWQMPNSGYTAPWNSSLTYQFPILGWQ